jgi:hypothetical protein
MKPTEFAFDRSWDFAVPRGELWSVLSDTSSFSTWWPWLRAFDAVPLEVGAMTRCAIGPPLPYVLSITLEVIGVIDEESVEVAVSGDLRGPARLEVGERADGSYARLVWLLEVRRPMLRMAAVVGRPVLQWGHDWVVSNGVEQFRSAITAERRRRRS